VSCDAGRRNGRVDRLLQGIGRQAGLVPDTDRCGCHFLDTSSTVHNSSRTLTTSYSYRRVLEERCLIGDAHIASAEALTRYAIEGAFVLTRGKHTQRPCARIVWQLRPHFSPVWNGGWVMHLRSPGRGAPLRAPAGGCPRRV